MKSFLLLFSVTVMFAGRVLAGGTMPTMKEFLEDPADADVFRETELQIDLFGGYQDNFGSGFGGGLGASAFFFRYIGFGIEGGIWDGSGSDPTYQAVGSLILRYPITQGLAASFAPYAFGGGGIFSNGMTGGFGQAGGGLEYRATSRVGIFGDARYIWGAAGSDGVLSRVGLRIAF